MLKNVEQNALNIPKPQSGKTTDATLTRSTRTAPAAYSVANEDEVYTDSRSRLQNLASVAVDQERSARVHQLHAMVKSGKYQFDPSEVATAVIAGTRKGD